jgi:hypothetical protein
MRALVIALLLFVGDQTPNPAACITAHGDVVYGALGWDHYVSLVNACDQEFSCRVSTDVNPTPIDVVVPALQTVSILTFRGSPARVFTPYVTCSVTTRP